MVLDCGAMGIVAPMVMDAAEAESIVAATKYPPRGNRSIGGGMHALNFGATAEEYYQKGRRRDPGHHPDRAHQGGRDRRRDLCRARSRRRVRRAQRSVVLDERRDGSPPGKELFEATLTRIREAAQRQKLPCGLHVFSAADALKRAREGWQFIAVVSELKMMLDGAAEIVRQVDPQNTATGFAKY